jgi:hypothetical protein
VHCYPLDFCWHIEWKQISWKSLFLSPSWAVQGIISRFWNSKMHIFRPTNLGWCTVWRGQLGVSCVYVRETTKSSRVFASLFIIYGETCPLSRSWGDRPLSRSWRTLVFFVILLEVINYVSFWYDRFREFRLGRVENGPILNRTCSLHVLRCCTYIWYMITQNKQFLLQAPYGIDHAGKLFHGRIEPETRRWDLGIKLPSFLKAKWKFSYLSAKRHFEL